MTTTATSAYVGEAVADANVAALNAASADLTSDQRRSFDSHLLGGLACYVDAETFARVLEAARKFATR